MKKAITLFIMLCVSALAKEDQYDLMLKSFVYSNDIKSAYRLAKKLVYKLDKNDIYYREWLAKLALWNDKPQEALKEYHKLYRILGKKEYETKALDLALALKRYDIATEILSNKAAKGDVRSLKKLLDIYDYESEFEKALSSLRRYGNLLDKKSLYLYFFKFYKRIGDVKGLKNTAKSYEREYGNIPTEIALYLSKRELAAKRYQKAYEILQKADKETPFYLKTLFGMAKLQNDEKKAFETLKRLYALGKAEDYYVAQLITLYIKREKFDKAADMALREYKKGKNPIFISLFIQSAQKSGRWREIVKLLESIKNEKIYLNPYYRIVLARAYMELKEVEAAKKTFEKALKEISDSQELVTSYMWFLIETQDIEGMREFLKRYSKRYKLPQEALLSLYLFLKEEKKALEIIKQRLKRNGNDFSMLIIYSDLLYTVGKFEECDNIRYKTYRMMKSMLKKERALLYDFDFFYNFLRLSMYFENYPKIAELFSFAKKHYDFRFNLSSKVNFYLMKNFYDTAQYYIERYRIRK